MTSIHEIDPNWREAIDERPAEDPVRMCPLCAEFGCIVHEFGDGDVIFSCPNDGEFAVDEEELLDGE